MKERLWKGEKENEILKDKSMRNYGNNDETEKKYQTKRDRLSQVVRFRRKCFKNIVWIDKLWFIQSKMAKLSSGLTAKNFHQLLNTALEPYDYHYFINIITFFMHIFIWQWKSKWNFQVIIINLKCHLTLGIQFFCLFSVNF